MNEKIKKILKGVDVEDTISFIKIFNKIKDLKGIKFKKNYLVKGNYEDDILEKEPSEEEIGWQCENCGSNLEKNEICCCGIKGEKWEYTVRHRDVYVFLVPDYDIMNEYRGSIGAVMGSNAYYNDVWRIIIFFLYNNLEEDNNDFLSLSKFFSEY